MPKKRIDLTIGTDPEFALFSKYDHQLTRADNFPFFASKSPTSRIGCDGAGTPVEIRPHPAKITNISAIIGDIDNILKQIGHWCSRNGFTMEAGARVFDMSIGAHIHFGGKEILFYDNDNRHNEYNPIRRTISREERIETEGMRRYTDFLVKPNIEKLISCLDCYLTPIINFFIPQSEIVERRAHGYGNLTEYRRQPWGIEYRTPYSFLFSPLLTNATFALASLLAYNYKQYTPNKNLYGRVIQYYYAMRPNEDRKAQKSIYKTIKPIIIEMMKYNSPNPEYNNLILSLFNLIEQGKMVKERDVLVNYKLNNLKNPPFSITFGIGRYISALRSNIEPFITNKSKGCFYIYQIPSSKYLIKITSTLPRLFEGICEQNNSYSDKGGFSYSMGISSSFLVDMLVKREYIHRLIKYLNKLRLPTEV